jgi:hypothetical protein
MPGHLSATVMFVSLVAIALAANRAAEFEDAARGPASIAGSEKERVLNASMRVEPILLHTEKLHGPLFVTLGIVDPAPKQVGDVFTLRGMISARKMLDGVDYNWTLPPEVALVQGELTGHLGNLSPNQAHPVDLTLRKVSGENGQVHLVVGASLAGAHFADSAQYNTELQAQIEAQKLQMKDDTARATGRVKQLRIFH